MHQIGFDKLLIYNPGRRGITIEVMIRTQDSFVDFQAKLDTGAEGCIFARRLGEEIGIEIEEGERQTFSTATGSFLTYGHNVTLIVADIQFDSYFFFAENESFNRNVLGRHGWLDRVIVGINDYDGALYLSKYE